jgi:intein/homing endonuclease
MRFEEPVWKTAKELTKNDYFGMVINNNDVIPNSPLKNFNKYKTEQIQLILDKPEYWYMMGYFVGDGWIQETKKKKTRYNISLICYK